MNKGDLSSSDIIEGGAGTDTLYAVVETASTLRSVLSSVENVEFEVLNKTAGGIETFTANFDKSSGVQKVTVKNFTSDTGDEDTVVIAGVTTATSLKITDDVGGANRANNFTMTYDGVTGAADSASVEVGSTVAASTLGNITVAGIETLTVSSTGGAGAGYKVVAADATALTLNASAKSGGAVDLAGAKIATLNINAADDVTVTDVGAASAKLRTVNIDSQTADKTVTLTNLTPTPTAGATDAVVVNVKGAGKATISIDTDFGTQSATNADTVTINAATNTGGVTFNATAFTNNAPRVISVTGGSGNDTVTVAPAGLDKYDTIALGDGTGDKLAVTASFSTSAAANLFYTDTTVTADLPAITGVEIASVTLSDSGNAQTVDTTSASFASTLELLGDIQDANTTINNIAIGQSIKLGKTLDLSNSSVVLDLNQKGATSSAPASSLTITSDLLETSTADADVDTISANKVISVALDLASSDADVTDVKIAALSFDKATTVTVTSAEKVTVGAIDAADKSTLDFSGVTAETALTVDTTNDYTVKGSATAKTTFTMSTGLDNDDTIVGGTATTDVLTATINGLTATTGALKISGVETIKLTVATAASTVNAAGIVGASVIEVGNGTALTGTDLTLTNLAAGTALQLGTTGTLLALGEIDVALADATGTNDTLTVIIVDTTTDDHIDMELKGTGIETLIFADAIAAGTGNDRELTVTNFAANKIILTGGTTDEVFDLARANSEKLNAATREVDGSAFDGLIVAVAATNTATTFKSKVAGSTFTGSAVNDTMQIGTATNFVGAGTNTFAGGTGSDTLTIYAKGSATLTGVTGVETINVITSGTAADYTSNAYSVTVAGGTVASSPTGAQLATTLNVSGGLAGTTVTLLGDIDDNGARTIDASTNLGSIALTFANAGLVQSNLSDAIIVKGGQGTTDLVTVKAAGNNSNLATGTFTMSGVEKLVLSSKFDTTNASGANTVDLTNVTGLSTVGVFSTTSSNDAAAFTNAASGITFEIGQTGVSSEMASDVTITHASSSGTADTLSIKLIDTNAGSSTPTITTDGIETLTMTLNDSTEDHSISLANTNANAATLNVVGVNTSADLTINALASAYATVSATGLKGKLTIDTGAIGTAAMTITGGEGNDIIGMKNAASVLDGGTKASDNDTLNISFSGTGGALIVDLSSTTDQVQMFNGLANAAVQKNFESVNASAYVQTNSVGADITGSTGANTIVGTAYADTIRTNGGGDTVTGGRGADTIILGAGVDNVLVNQGDSTTGAITLGTTNISASVDLIYGAANDDVIQFVGLTATTAATGVALDTVAIVVSGSVDAFAMVRGTYSTSTGVFTAGTASTDNDYLVQGNDDSASDSITSVVLMDIVGTVTYDLSTTGQMTLNIA